MYKRTLNLDKNEIDTFLAHLGLNSIEEVIELQNLKHNIADNLGIKDKKSLVEAIQDYLNRGFLDKSQQTKKRYEKVLFDFFDYINQKNQGDVLVNEIPLQLLEEYLQDKMLKRAGRNQVINEAKNIAASTYNLRVAAIRGLFNHCQENQWVITSPAQKLKMFKDDEVMPSFLRIHECSVLLDVAKRKVRYKNRDYALVSFLLMTGARIEEVCRAQINDIDFIRNTITLRGVKGRGQNIRQRILPLMGNLSEVLTDWVQSVGYSVTAESSVIPKENVISDYLFPNMTSGPGFGQRMSQENIRNIINRLFLSMNEELVRLGLPENHMHLTPHALRHTFGILCLDNRILLPAIQEYMGHQSLQTTGRYLKLGFDEYRKIGENFNPFVNFELEEFLSTLKNFGEE